MLSDEPKNIELAVRAQEVSAVDDGMLWYWPTSLCDPFMLPQYKTNATNFSTKNRKIFSDSGLPHGHFSRILIAYLLHLKDYYQGVSYIKLPKSRKQLYREFTKKTMSGGTQKLLEDTLSKVLNMKIIDISSMISEDKSHIDENNLTYPNYMFNKKDIDILNESCFPIDGRALLYFRDNDCILASDLYLFATQKMYKMKRSSLLLRWNVLEDSIFINSTHKNRHIFKKRLERAINLVQSIYFKLNIEINEKGILLRKSPPHIEPLKIITTEKSKTNLENFELVNSL